MFSSNASQVSSSANYIEDFFSAWLRTGTGSSQTVTTGIEEDTGALVISKSRSAATDWAWYDTFRGATKDLVSNSTAAQTTQSQGLTSFNSNGHTWGTLAKVNTSGATYVDFVLKPTPKFFDVVTFTTASSTNNNQRISHNLGSTPGCIIVKAIGSTSNWSVWHRSLSSATGSRVFLNTTAASANAANYWGSSGPTVTDFGVNTDYFGTGATYVAYLFAHDAGGFGLTGEDNVISCGSYTGNDNTNGPEINLGWEPQWVMIKNATTAGNSWRMFDNMRGMDVNTTGSGDGLLSANLSSAEAYTNRLSPTATGFKITDTAGDVNSPSGNTFIYIAIRRGPMKVPESGTSVFAPVAYTGTGTTNTITTNIVTDSLLISGRASVLTNFIDRLRGTGIGTSKRLITSSTSEEGTLSSPFGYLFDNNAGVGLNSTTANASGTSYIAYNFRRAPGFFDEICYTSNGSGVTLNHNLTVVPELVIFKARNNAGNDWVVYRSTAPTKRLDLNSTNAEVNEGAFGTFTSTTLALNVDSNINSSISGRTYVAYLFASAPGVSKVGSYTGTGTTQQINCGFTGGARFVLIKRTDSTGDWYVWDSARGIVAGNDSYLLLNSTAAEVTSTDYIDTYSAGFEISSTAPAAINASGGTFLFFAVA